MLRPIRNDVTEVSLNVREFLLRRAISSELGAEATESKLSCRFFSLKLPDFLRLESLSFPPLAVS